MNKYRIVSREDNHGLKYFAQIKFFWFFWGDCKVLKSPGSMTFQFENPSRDLKLVENSITFLIEMEKKQEFST